MNTVTPILAGHLAAVLTVAESRGWPMPAEVVLLPGQPIILRLASADDVRTWADGSMIAHYKDTAGLPHLGADAEVIDCPVRVYGPMLSAVTA